MPNGIIAGAVDKVYEAGMTLEDIQRQCIDDSDVYFPDLVRDFWYLGLAIAGEAGELANHLKKYYRCSLTSEAREVHLEEARKELPDILIYLCLIAEELGVDLTEAYMEKREFNNDRYLGQSGSDSGEAESA